MIEYDGKWVSIDDEKEVAHLGSDVWYAPFNLLPLRVRIRVASQYLSWLPDRWKRGEIGGYRAIRVCFAFNVGIYVGRCSQYPRRGEQKWIQETHL